MKPSRPSLLLFRALYDERLVVQPSFKSAVVEAAVGKAVKTAEPKITNPTHRAPQDGLNSPTKMDRSTGQERDATCEDIVGAMDSIHWGSSIQARHAWKSAETKATTNGPRGASG